LFIVKPMKTATREGPSTVVGSKVPHALADAFRAAAEQHGQSVSARVRFLMRRDVHETFTAADRESA